MLNAEILVSFEIARGGRTPSRSGRYGSYDLGGQSAGTPTKLVAVQTKLFSSDIKYANSSG